MVSWKESNEDSAFHFPVMIRKETIPQVGTELMANES